MHDELGHGITCIDTGYVRPGHAACYLVKDGDEAAVVETGTTRTVPRILDALARAGLAPSAVRYVIPTHVHLDHAGGAGALLQQFPNAVLLVHPRGARHLIDPSQLIAGAIEVYGAGRFAQLYGTIVPAPAPRVVVADNGSAWTLGHRQLLVRDTPGHARHHFCVWDERSRGWFSGDTFGVAYRELAGLRGPSLFPTTTPVQFDPAALLASITLLMAQHPHAFYLTHYGRIAATAAAADALRAQIEVYARLAASIRHEDAGAEEELAARLAAYTVTRLRAAGCRWNEFSLRRFLASDMRLNAAGLLSWRKARA